MTKLFSAALLILFSAVLSARGQGSFGNLNFESATVPDLPPGQFNFGNVPASQALPGWMCFYGTNQTALVSQNTLSLGSVNISILGPNYVSGAIIAGKYSAVLQAGGAGIQIPASIAQSGTIPFGSLSIQFVLDGDAADLGVTFGGQNIPIVRLGAMGSFGLYGGDVSGFAGTSGELRFSERPIIQPFGNVTIDSITFSLQPIPEPGTLALTALAVTALCLIRRRSRRA